MGHIFIRGRRLFTVPLLCVRCPLPTLLAATQTNGVLRCHHVPAEFTNEGLDGERPRYAAIQELRTEEFVSLQYAPNKYKSIAIITTVELMIIKS